MDALKRFVRTVVARHKQPAALEMHSTDSGLRRVIIEKACKRLKLYNLEAKIIIRRASASNLMTVEATAKQEEDFATVTVAYDKVSKMIVLQGMPRQSITIVASSKEVDFDPADSAKINHALELRITVPTGTIVEILDANSNINVDGSLREINFKLLGASRLTATRIQKVTGTLRGRAQAVISKITSDCDLELGDTSGLLLQYCTLDLLKVKTTGKATAEIKAKTECAELRALGESKITAPLVVNDELEVFTEDNATVSINGTTALLWAYARNQGVISLRSASTVGLRAYDKSRIQITDFVGKIASINKTQAAHICLQGMEIE